MYQALLYYEFAAMGGNEEARLTLGYKYNFGHSVPKDCTKAAEYFGMLAQTGISLELNAFVYISALALLSGILSLLILSECTVAEEAATTGLRYNYDMKRLLSEDEVT